MEQPIKICVKSDEPHKEDPNPNSNLVFLDNDGTYYEVNAIGWHNDMECEPGWEARMAIRKQIQGRAKAILVPA